MTGTNQKLREALQAISHIDDTTNHSVDASAALDRIGQIARQALALPTAEPIMELKEHEIREVVNTVTATARAYRDTQQLRARVADVLVPILRQSGAPGLKWAEIDQRPINAVLVPCDKLKEMQDELHCLRLTAKRIQQAVTEYHYALGMRQPGGIAANKLTYSIQEIMGMPWIQGATLQAVGETRGG